MEVWPLRNSSTLGVKRQPKTHWRATLATPLLRPEGREKAEANGSGRSGAMPLSCGFCWEAPRMHSYLVGPTECSDSPVLGAWSHCWQHITRGRRRSARAQCPFIPSDEIFSMINIWMAWERRWRWISFQWDWWLGHRSEAGDAFSSVTSYWSH